MPVKLNPDNGNVAVATELAVVIPFPEVKVCENCGRRSIASRMFMVWDQVYCGECVGPALEIAQLADEIIDELEQLTEHSAFFLLDRLIDHFVELRTPK